MDIEGECDTEENWWTEGAGDVGGGVLIKKLHVWRNTKKLRKRGGAAEETGWPPETKANKGKK